MREPPPGPEFPYPIYDAHHHLWDLNAVHYPWLAAKGVKRFFGDPTPIQKNYLPENLREDIGNLPVEKSVHIQVGAANDQHLLESQTIQQMADQSGLASAIVAFCALEQSDMIEQLDELAKLDNFRGVRQIVGRSPEEDAKTGTDSLLANRQWQRGLQELENRNLSFDLQLIPDQMQRAAEVFANIENLPVALCHCGSPWFLNKEYRDAKGEQMWKEGLQALADLPQVYCKISGLSMFDHHWTVDSLQPIIETVIDTFGAERCMFGSNFPVDKLHTDYQRLWRAYLQIVEALPGEDQRKLFKVNCARFYKI